MSKNYLYLARRDKKGIKILLVINGDKSSPTRINPDHLNIPSNLKQQIIQSINDNKMLWEPWLEGAENYTTLKKSLILRGFSNIPTTMMPVLGNKTKSDIKIDGTKVKTMMKKLS